jgi:hypothetical protein
MAEPVSAHGRIAWAVQCPWEFRLCDAGQLPARAAVHTWLADFSIARSARTIDQAVLAALTFKVVLPLTRRGLTDVHTGPPGQMISRDLILTVLDSDMAMYTHNNTDDEFTQQNFFNSKGITIGPKIGDGSLVIGVIGVFLVHGIFPLEIPAPRQH